MGISKAEKRRRVFLVARTIFVGDKARIREKSIVKRVVSERKTDFSQLSKDLPENSIVDIIAHLLENQVFESELRAKLQFPELFQVSAARSIQHDISEQEAARSEEEALEEALVSLPMAGDRSIQPTETERNGTGTLLRSNVAAPDVYDPVSSEPSNLPSLYPTYVSYPVQHLLLNETQRLLETSCFDFASQHVPGILVENQWTCAEAIELSKWALVLPTASAQIADETLQHHSGKSLAIALKATHPLRHAAVHRLPTSAKGIEQMLQSGLSLLQALKDTNGSLKLENLLLDFRAKVRDLELHKNHFEARLDDELCNIREERAALDVREKIAKETMIQEDRLNTERISALLKPSIAALGDDKEAAVKLDGKLELLVESQAEFEEIVTDTSDEALEL